MTDIDSVIETIAKKLRHGDDCRAFRKVVRRHLKDLDALRGEDFDWERIASKLTEAGARHKRGQLISAHQLRTEFARLKREPAPVDSSPSTADPHNGESQSNATEAATSSAKVGAGLRSIESRGGTRPGGAAQERLSELLNTRIRTVEADDD